jgi:regulator of sigma E protease
MDFSGGLYGFGLPFLAVLTALVFVHELGHYLVARWNGVRVEVFSIGFGPELFGWNDRAGTRWKFSLIPLGGYVKMFGDANAASMPAEGGERMSAEERAVAFPHKRLGQRSAIVAAGPIANFLFAIVVLAGLFAINGQPFTPAVVGEVVPESPAAAAGILPGDRILAVDGNPLASFEELQGIVRDSAGEPRELRIARDGEELVVTVTPALREQTDRFGTVHRIGQIGITRTGVEFVRSNPLLAPIEAVQETGRMIGGTLVALGEMIVGSRGTEELGGPLRIAQMSGEVASDGFVPALWFTAVLSINLGLINLFPIPMLDGGHLLFYSIEAVRGRPMNERAQEIAFRIGLAMVLTLMVFATWNDLTTGTIGQFFRSLIS